MGKEGPDFLARVREVVLVLIPTRSVRTGASDGAETTHFEPHGPLFAKAEALEAKAEAGLAAALIVGVLVTLLYNRVGWRSAMDDQQGAM